MKELLKKITLCLLVALCSLGLYNEFVKPVTTVESVKEEEQSLSQHGTAGITAAIMNVTNEELKENVSIEPNPGGEIVKSSYVPYEITTSSGIDIAEPDPEPVIEYKEKDASGEFYVDATKLNVRSEANTDSDIIKTLGCNDKVSVKKEITVYIDEEKQEKTWYEIDGGFVRSDYLSDKPVYEYLGDFRITYYCNCPKCCGKWSTMTASGATTVEGVTVAADPSIPFGTKLLINDHIYTVQDRGGAIKGKHIDIYIEGHDRALSQTYLSGPVYKVP